MSGIRTRRALFLVVEGTMLVLGTLLVIGQLTGGGRPPRASPTPVPVAVRLYFGVGPGDPCDAVAPVERTVTAATPEPVLRALLAGPTAEERTAGYRSWFSAATAGLLERATLAGGTLEVSFHDLRPVIPNASSSCGSTALLASLDTTLLALPGVDRVRYAIEGDEAAFYEWLQLGVPPR